MATTELDTLLVKIAADTSQLRGEMAKATNAMAKAMQASAKEAERTNAMLARVGGTIRGALGGALAALTPVKLVQLAEAAAKFGADIENAARKLRLTTDEMQALQFAGKKVGLDSEAVVKSLEKFGGAIAEAATGQDAAKTFAALGVNIRGANGAVKDMNALLGEVADKMLKLEPAARMAFADKFFGRDAEEFLRLIEGGSAGLRKMQQEARDIGAVMDERVVARLAEANRSIDASSQALSVKWKTAMADISEAWAEVLGFIVRFSNKAEEAISQAQRLGKGLDTAAYLLLQKLAPETTAGFNKIGNSFADALVDALDRAMPGINLRLRLMAEAAKAAVDAATSAAQGVLAGPLDREGARGRGMAGSGHGPYARNATRALPGGATAALGGKSESQGIIDGLADAYAKLRAEWETGSKVGAELAEVMGKLERAGASKEQIADARGLFDATKAYEAAKALREYAKENADLAATVAAEASGRRDLVLQLELEHKLRDALGPQYVEQNRVMIEGLAKQRAAIERHRETIQASQQELSRLGEIGARALEDGLAAAFDKSGNAAEKFRDIARGVLNDLLRMMIRLSITNPLMNLLGGQQLPTLGSVGGVLGSLFGGANPGASVSNLTFSSLGMAGFAEGGRPPVGMPSIVGERGPELFIPNVAGTIVSNDNLGRMGGSTYNIDARGADAARIAQLESVIRQLGGQVRRIDGTLEHRAISATVDARRRGGAVANY